MRSPVQVKAITCSSKCDYPFK